MMRPFSSMVNASTCLGIVFQRGLRRRPQPQGGRRIRFPFGCSSCTSGAQRYRLDSLDFVKNGFGYYFIISRFCGSGESIYPGDVFDDGKDDVHDGMRIG